MGGVRVLVGGLLLAVALAGCAQSPAPPQVAPASPSAASRAELLRRQGRLEPLAQAIQDLADPLEDPIVRPLPSGDDRYGAVRLDLERDLIEVWWAGPLPPEVRAVLRRYPDVRVEVHHARWSSNELVSASRRVADVLRAHRLGPDVTTDAVEHDVRTGRILVHVIDPEGRWTAEHLHARLDRLTPVPMDFVLQRGPTLGL